MAKKTSHCVRKTVKGEPLGEARMGRPSSLVLVSDGTFGALRREFRDAILLDRLKAAGELGSGKDADTRHNAGLALRELYEETGFRRSSLVSAYEVRVGMAYGDDFAPTLREVKARARYNEAIWQLPGQIEVVQACIHDEMPKRMGFLRNGLDALARRL